MQLPWTQFVSLPAYAVNNRALDGSTIVDRLAQYPTNIAPYYRGNPHDTVSIWAGSNDIATGAAPATVYANLTAYIAAAHATGFKVITATMASRSCCDAQKDVLNPLILANTGGTQGAAGVADFVVDFTGTPLGCDGCYANPTYFTGDQIHPSLFSRQTIEAPAFQSAVTTINVRLRNNVISIDARRKAPQTDFDAKRETRIRLKPAA